MFADLEPYCCTFPDCDIGCTLFKASKSWAKHELTHLNTAQWVDRRCVFCSPTSKLLCSRVEYLRHVGRHLLEISLAVLPRTSHADDDSSFDSGTDYSRIESDDGDLSRIEFSSSGRSDDEERVTRKDIISKNLSSYLRKGSEFEDIIGLCREYRKGAY